MRKQEAALNALPPTHSGVYATASVGINPRGGGIIPLHATEGGDGEKTQAWCKPLELNLVSGNGLLGRTPLHFNRNGQKKVHWKRVEGEFFWGCEYGTNSSLTAAGSYMESTVPQTVQSRYLICYSGPNH